MVVCLSLGGENGGMSSSLSPWEAFKKKFANFMTSNNRVGGSENENIFHKVSKIVMRTKGGGENIQLWY